MQEKRIVSYKGFDENLQCLDGFQYEIGKEYHQDGEIKVCEKGFHACTNPIDVLKYYGCRRCSRYCVVEQWGNISRSEDDSKMASSDIKIVKEITLEELIDIGIELVQSGELSVSNRTILQYINNDFRKKPKSIFSYENEASIINNGVYGGVNIAGRFVNVVSRQDSVNICNNGKFATIIVRGHGSIVNDTGLGTAILNFGFGTSISSSSSNSQIINHGDCVYIKTSGSCIQIDSDGDDAKIIALGNGSSVRAKTGSWITLTEWGWIDMASTWLPICTKTEFVDGEKIKEGVWYEIKDGEFVEVFNS